MEFVKGGVCAAKGFKASGIHCGIRKNKTKKDLALIVSDVKASAAAVYTSNLVKGAPIYVTKENIAKLTDIGVDYISSGALTHSAPILDLSLKNLHPIEG